MSPIAVYWCACGQTATTAPAEQLECCSLAGVPLGWVRLNTSAEPDLPASAYPFTIEWRSRSTGLVLHSLDVAEPGYITVPARWPEPVNVELRYADGHHESYP